MTKLFRHTILAIAAISLLVGCKDNAIPSDTLGTDGITQSRIVYDTIRNMRDLNPGPEGDTIDVEEAVRIGLAMPSGSTTSESYYVLAAVKGFSQPFDATYGNVSPIITNKIANRQMICYRLLSFKRKGVVQKFTDAEQLQIGDIVVVYGQIQNRYGAPQLTQGCYLVTSDNPLSGYKPAPKVVLSETFDEGMGGFTIDNEIVASDDIWKHVEATGGKQGYMCANEGKLAEESDSWLISPTMDLTVCKDTTLMTFSHWYQGSADLRDEQLRVMVSTNDGATWEPLPVEGWNNGKLKRFTAATVDLTEHKSATTKVAFVYTSTAESAMTWSIQNIRIGEPADE
jgi:hypothetical protein